MADAVNMKQRVMHAATVAVEAARKDVTSFIAATLLDPEDASALGSGVQLEEFNLPPLIEGEALYYSGPSSDLD